MIAVYTVAFKIYKWDQLRPVVGWTVTADCNAKKGCLVVENKEDRVYFQLDETFHTLSEKDKTKKVDEAKILAFGENKLVDTDFYWSLFFIVAIFPIFRLGHLLGHWIIWGRIK